LKRLEKKNENRIFLFAPGRFWRQKFLRGRRRCTRPVRGMEDCREKINYLAADIFVFEGGKFLNGVCSSIFG
jgi:hypothetical protein